MSVCLSATPHGRNTPLLLGPYCSRVTSVHTWQRQSPGSGQQLYLAVFLMYRPHCYSTLPYQDTIPLLPELTRWTPVGDILQPYPEKRKQKNTNIWPRLWNTSMSHSTVGPLSSLQARFVTHLPIVMSLCIFITLSGSIFLHRGFADD